MSPDADREGEPLADVEIGAAMRAKTLRFKRVPETEVSLEADAQRESDALEHEPEGESDSQGERENLPDKVEPGVTYRNVRAAWRGGARIVVRRK